MASMFLKKRHFSVQILNEPKQTDFADSVRQRKCRKGYVPPSSVEAPKSLKTLDSTED